MTSMETTKEAAMSLPGSYKHFHHSVGNFYAPYNPFAMPPPGLTSLLLPGQIQPVDGTALLEQVKMDPSMNILQIKGWGSGIQQSDYEALFKRQGVNVDLKDSTFLELVEQTIGPMLAPLFGLKFWLQWDGDQIKYDTYGYLLAAVAHILNRYDMLHGLICMKLTEAPKARNFVQSFMREKGGDKLRELCPNLPMILVAYPIEKDEKVEAEQKRTGYGFYGASLNNMFAGAKTIVAFGGGGVLSAEDANGYVNTSIIAIDMTRKGGTDVSQFTRKYMRM